MGFDIDTLPGGQIDIPSCPGSDRKRDLADHVLSVKSGNGKRLLLMGHLNTVFPSYSPFQNYRRRGDRVPASLCGNKKGGLMDNAYALKALDARQLLEDMAVDD